MKCELQYLQLSLQYGSIVYFGQLLSHYLMEVSNPRAKRENKVDTTIRKPFKVSNMMD
jgi:hypothetical protein